MKLHFITVGKPKLSYANMGWEEYLHRLQRYHEVKISHIPDKFGHNSDKILKTAGNAYIVALELTGKQFTSPELAEFLKKRELEAREICFIIGGPEGLPQAVVDATNSQWSFSKLTFPHDLAMVILLEALYRASTINAGLPYHK